MKHIRAKLSWVVLGVYWPCLFISTHISSPPHITIYGHDFTLHLLAYMTLTLLFWLARFGAERPVPWRLRAYKVVFLMACYGAFDELSQALVNRHCDIYDWLSDMAGVLLALAMLFAIRRCIYWLIIYWLALLVVTHWPQDDTPFVQLPAFWRQFELAYVVVGYLVLTLLWWRSLCPEPRFMINRTILAVSLIVLPAYALLDEMINVLMRRGFSMADLFCGLAGIVVGILCSAAFARHHMVTQPAKARDADD